MATRSSSEASIVLTMVRELPPLGQAEIERALRLTLNPPMDVAEERVYRLGFLAEVLERQGRPANKDPLKWPACPVVPRPLYELLVEPPAPTAGTLVAEYGSWIRACRAAAGLQGDGRTTGPGRPWAIRRNSRPSKFRWNERDCRAWLRRCALELARRPSTTDYDRWRQAFVRLPGRQTIRVPTKDSVIKHVGVGSWLVAIERLNLTDNQLDDARAERLPCTSPVAATVKDRILELDDPMLQLLGMSRTQARKLSGLTARRALPLSAAIELAQALDGSLDWLAGQTATQGEPPMSDLVIDCDAINELRAKHEIAEADLLKRAGLKLGAWRRIRNGRRELTLGELARFARAFGVSVADLLRN